MPNIFVDDPRLSQADGYVITCVDFMELKQEIAKALRRGVWSSSEGGNKGRLLPRVGYRSTFHSFWVNQHTT